MKILDAAILLCERFVEDAEFTSNNLKTHAKHAREMGISTEEYNRRAKQLSETSTGGNIIGYVRPDGREARLNISTGEYVVFTGNTVVTFYKLRPGQIKRVTKGEKL